MRYVVPGLIALVIVLYVVLSIWLLRTSRPLRFALISTALASASVVWLFISGGDSSSFLFNLMFLPVLSVIILRSFVAVCVHAVLRRQSPRLRWISTTLLTIVLCAAYVYHISPEQDPPLVRGIPATTGGDWVCPRQNDSESAVTMSGPHGSSELTERLTDMYPRGTKETVLVEGLQHQRFKSSAPCSSDPSIRTMTFSGEGFIKTFAMVGWKVDSNGLVLWTKGFVLFTGP